MKQVIATLGTGSVEVVDVPRPRPGPGELVIANEYSVVSTGTERTLVTFGRSSIAEKVRRERSRIDDVVDKAVTDGVESTVRAVRTRLETPIALGYSSAGIVLEVGEGVEDFAPGDRVAANGAHADIVTVQARLSAKIPEDVPSRDAAFGTLVSVAMNALREADVDFGSVIAVVGHGLIGSLVARVAAATGHRVVSFDPAAETRDGDQELFADLSQFRRRLEVLTAGRGADAVVVAADVGEKANDTDPMSFVGDVARRRGTVVLVGDGDPTIDRQTWYHDELRFVVAHAYGPGRDDDRWERGDVAYPTEHVRWTARQNLQLALDLLERGELSVSDLVDVETDLSDAPRVYDELARGQSGTTLFHYDSPRTEAPTTISHRPLREAIDSPGVAVIGAGNFATRTLLPALADSDVDVRLIASRSGLSSVVAAREFGVASSTTNIDRILDDPGVDVVFVATRHDSHPGLAARALRAGKHVWLEKPLAVDREGLAEIVEAWRETRDAGRELMVGFNRRFAPTARKLRAKLDGMGTFSAIYTVNAGKLPREHWLRDRRIGGGRIVGEACHFVDLLRFLAAAEIRTSHAVVRPDESATLTFEFASGSIGTVHYLTSGHPSVPKERLEVYSAGRILRLDNFKSLEVFEDGFAPLRAMQKLRRSSQDKGHADAIAAFLDALRSGEPAPIPFTEAVEVTDAIFDALDR